jgi:hypothetical protein
MAIEPLYISKALMLQRLRMSETTDTDTLTMIDQAISDVRMEFFRRLTMTRALEIVAITPVENPTTIDPVLRNIAEVTEVYWVLYKLICILPTMFIETAHAIDTAFDNTPITRDSESLQKFLKCLWASIETNLGQLIIPVNDVSGAVKSFSVGRQDPYLLNQHFVGLPGILPP